MSSKRQKLLARINWYLQSSLKRITQLITGIKYYYRGNRFRQVSLYYNIDGLAQMRGNFIANALDLARSCA